jgi:hypothetical protein
VLQASGTGLGKSTALCSAARTARLSMSGRAPPSINPAQQGHTKRSSQHHGSATGAAAQCRLAAPSVQLPRGDRKHVHIVPLLQRLSDHSSGPVPGKRDKLSYSQLLELSKQLSKLASAAAEPVARERLRQHFMAAIARADLAQCKQVAEVAAGNQPLQKSPVRRRKRGRCGACNATCASISQQPQAAGNLWIVSEPDNSTHVTGSLDAAFAACAAGCALCGTTAACTRCSTCNAVAWCSEHYAAVKQAHEGSACASICSYIAMQRWVSRGVMTLQWYAACSALVIESEVFQTTAQPVCMILRRCCLLQTAGGYQRRSRVTPCAEVQAAAHRVSLDTGSHL